MSKYNQHNLKKNKTRALILFCIKIDHKSIIIKEHVIGSKIDKLTNRIEKRIQK